MRPSCMTADFCIGPTYISTSLSAILSNAWAANPVYFSSSNCLQILAGNILDFWPFQRFPIRLTFSLPDAPSESQSERISCEGPGGCCSRQGAAPVPAGRCVGHMGSAPLAQPSSRTCAPDYRRIAKDGSVRTPPLRRTVVLPQTP